MSNLLGKRYQCSVCEATVLVTKAGDGEARCPWAAHGGRPGQAAALVGLTDPTLPVVEVDGRLLRSDPALLDAAIVDVVGEPALLVVTALADVPPAGLAALRRVPLLTAGWSPLDPPRADAVDLVLDDDRALAHARAGCARAPRAATAAALLLRDAGGDWWDGLVRESTTYSMLQGGAEFLAWRAARGTPTPAGDPGPRVRVAPPRPGHRDHPVPPGPAQRARRGAPRRAARRADRGVRRAGTGRAARRRAVVLLGGGPRRVRHLPRPVRRASGAPGPVPRRAPRRARRPGRGRDPRRLPRRRDRAPPPSRRTSSRPTTPSSACPSSDSGSSPAPAGRCPCPAGSGGTAPSSC